MGSCLALREDAVVKLEWPLSHTSTSVPTATGTPYSVYSTLFDVGDEGMPIVQKSQTNS